MKTVFYLLIFACCIFSSFVSAQGWDLLHEAGLGRHTCGIRADNGSFIVGGETPFSLGITGNHDNYLMKISGQGDLIWTKFLDAEGQLLGKREFINRLPNGTFVAVQNAESEINHKLSCFDFDGILQWDFVCWPGNTERDWIDKVFVNHDGSLSIVSHKDLKLYIIRIDVNGSEIGRNQVHTDFGIQVIRNNNNGFYVISRDTLTNHLVLHETNLSGGFINTLEYPQIQYPHHPSLQLYYADNIELSPTGDFIFLDDHAVNTIHTQRKVNPNTYQEEIDTIYNEGLFVRFKTLKLPDGFIHVGAYDYYELDHGIQLLRTDFDGNVIFEKKINHRPGPEAGYSIISTHDDGFLIMGAHNTFAFGRPYLVKIDANGELFSGTVNGTVVVDDIQNCLVDEDDTPVEDWIVTAIKGDNIFATTTDASGDYSLAIDTGTFIVSIQEPNLYWSPCINDIEVNYINFDSTSTIDFPIATTIDCPGMSVSGTVATIRPCFARPGYISYCNYGTVTAENAYIEMNYDPYINLVSASIPYVDLGDNVYRFDLGDVEALECGDFQVSLFLDCDATVGASYCIDAHAFPDTLCGIDPAIWSGAFIEVSGTCETDDVNFRIKNIGDNDMTDYAGFVIIEDAILMMADSVELNINEMVDFPFPANGSTYTIMAEQVEGAPGQSYPIAVVEGCGENGSGGVSLGFANQFPFDDGNSYYDLDCPIATDSYDPNDKQGFPVGYGPEHKIIPGTPIEYLIRFQNTGSDTAFTVFIKDTLSQYLDFATFELGSSSHPVEWGFSGRGILKFNFPGIELPDSTTNEVGSNGFVSFKISPQLDTPLETVITNQAGIYFDFNDAIITNQTFHTIAIDFPEVFISSAQHPTLTNIEVLVRPNPAIDLIRLEIKNHQSNQYDFQLMDIHGKIVQQKTFAQESIQVARANLPAGIYFFRISAADGFISTGKILFK